jgi:hypothetical protein
MMSVTFFSAMLSADCHAESGDAECQIFRRYAKCRDAECRYAECCLCEVSHLYYTDCRDAECCSC